MELLDRALALADRELACLADGQVEAASALAGERDELLAAFFAAGLPPHGAQRSLALERLTRLLDIQQRLGAEARRLSEETLSELRRTGLETRRHGGYREANRMAVESGGRFLSKRG